MIEKFNVETQETDLASITGRAALVSGTAYGLHKTIKDMPKAPSPYFRKSMSRFAGMSSGLNQAENTIESTIGFKGFIKDFDKIKYSDQKIKNRINIKQLERSLGSLKGGYKERSMGLFPEIKGLYQDLDATFGGARIQTIGLKGNLDLVRLTAGNLAFDIPVVDQAGTMVLGETLENRYAARSALKGYDLAKGTVEIEGIDVALTKKYREELDRIKKGEISTWDIKRAATDRAVWEETRGKVNLSKTKASALGAIRREQVVSDVFNQKTRTAMEGTMRDLTSIPGYGGGSAGMFAKGIFATPQSLLSKGLPGAEATASAYQLIRQSQFVGAKQPSVNWMKGLDSGLGQFTVATTSDLDLLKRSAKKIGLNIGEMAGEEAILNMNTKVGIKNKMYSFNIDTSRNQTKFMQNLMRDIYNQAEETALGPKRVAKAMTSSGGLDGLNLDLNKKLSRLQDREATLTGEVEGLESKGQKLRKLKSQLAADMNEFGGRDIRNKLRAVDLELQNIQRGIGSRKGALGSIGKAIKEYGVLGFTAVTGEEVKVPGGDLSNFAKNIKMKDGELTIATESHYKFGVGSKLFTGGGGGKWTIKAEADLPTLLATMEQEKLFKATGQMKDVNKLKENFKDVQMLSVEDPVKVKAGALAPRESMTATMAYASNIIKNGSPEQIKRLEELGIVGGEFTGTNLNAKQIIEKIKGWHPNQSMEQILGGEEFLFGKVSETVMAPDISSTQAGIGKLGTLSERGAYNLQAMGLGDFLEDILGRKAEAFNPMDQLREVEAARGISEDLTARGMDVPIEKDIDRLFQPDLAARKAAMEGNERLTINLGKRIAGLEKVTVFSSETMSPFIGEIPGGGMSQLDMATKDLLTSISKGEDEAFQIAKAKRYQAAFAGVEDTITSNLFKGKIKGSIYGQAVSSLEGMDEAAKQMGKAMGLGDDIAAPLIAMSKKDIRRSFGKDAPKQAAEGQLWGMITREPIEGVHSTLPTNIRVAEDFGAPGKLDGAVYLSGEDASQSMIRRSLFVDFDKDTVNVIAAKSNQAKEAIESFYGVGGRQQTIQGSEFLESVKRMSAFELKGREPLDVTKLLDNELVAISASQKQMEKGAIGSFSNEFKNIHIGLREQLRPQMGRGAAEAFYLGEDFSHLFVENILKAKHQRKEALVAGSAQDALDIFTSKIGTPYASMGAGEKAQELQRMFDELTFGSKAVAEEVRISDAARVSEDLAGKMGYAKEIGEARMIEQAAEQADAVDSIIEKATNQRNAFRKISGINNVQNVLEAHEIGRTLQSTGDYGAQIAQRNISTARSLSMKMKDIGATSSLFMSKGLKNLGKWAILPTAAIGLAASLTTKPKVLEPAREAGAIHERDAEYAQGLGEASGGKTLFSIPESKVSSFDIRGQASMNTNIEALKAFSARNKAGLNMRLDDHRSHMDKHTIEEMINKGY